MLTWIALTALLLFSLATYMAGRRRAVAATGGKPAQLHSLPGYYGNVQRSEKVVVKGLNRDGRPVRYHATGLFAECVEHEVDHLEGNLYFDLLDSMEKLLPVRQRPQDEEDEHEDDGHQDQQSGGQPPHSRQLPGAPGVGGRGRGGGHPG